MWIAQMYDDIIVFPCVEGPFSRVFGEEGSTTIAHTEPKVTLVIDHQRLGDMSRHGAFGGFNYI